MNEKIAIVVDSGSDVSTKLYDGLDIFNLPLRVIVDGVEYTDNKDITSEEIFAVLDSSEVSTSLPLGEDIMAIFEDIKNQGYTHLIAITISSGLSGTFNVINNLASDLEGIETFVFDTKNISLGSGLLALSAAYMAKDNKSFDEIVNMLKTNQENSKVFFTVGTLDYLIKGGRIGLVAGTLANILSIKPIITCNEDGIYHTVDKVRGYRKVIKKMIDKASEFVSSAYDYRVVLLNANTKEDLNKIIDYAKEKFVDKEILVTNITPALAIHTGPEALGIAVIKY